MVNYHEQPIAFTMRTPTPAAGRCAHFRPFYHGETDCTGGVVPAEMTEKGMTSWLYERHWIRKPRAVSTSGEVGQRWRESAYAQRPSPAAVSLIVVGHGVQ